MQTQNRVPVQISALAETDYSSPTVCALCNDGTIWVYYPNGSEWHQLPNIPNTQSLNEPEY